MAHVIEYVASLLHLLGILLLVGGHLWFACLCVFIDRHRDRQGDLFLSRFLPVMANLFGLGVLLLFSSGVTKLLLWGEAGLIFLPDPYGWILFAKLLLYIIIVGHGLLIERRFLPALLQRAAQPTDTIEMNVTWRRVKRGARLNLLLVLVVLALGESLRYARL